MGSKSRSIHLNAQQYKGISTHDALVLFNSLNHPITMAGMLYIAKKRNLGEKINHHWVMHADKIKEYIEETKKPIPKGWKKTIELALKFNLKDRQLIYQLINAGQVKAAKFGRRRILYVDEHDLKRVIENHRKHNTKQGKNGKI